MPKIIIDNTTIDCRDRIPVLQAALEAGWDVPHYCYHPGLSVVASCRLCLMEMKMPHPKTQEMVWSPKLAPSCQTPVKDGMEVRFKSPAVESAQKHNMEYFLLNHPLDCPVCDQAGECYLQDYSYHFGQPESRMVDQKLKNPKKDIGSKTLLYADRCVMCTRCVRFTDEISGTHELCVINRGSRAEIDVFPGFPLDNPLQGNVVDICPVGCLLDKDFLFKRRVWELRGTPSVCPGCATGCTIRIDHADNQVYRLKPRYNPEVNDWWMCDEGRFGFRYIADRKRVTTPLLRRGMEELTPRWEEIPSIARYRFEDHVKRKGSASVVGMLSPFMATEEAWLLIRFLRGVAPDCALAMGPVPYEGDDQHFPLNGKIGVAEGAASGANPPKFTILKEKCPNRRGIEALLQSAGGVSLTTAEFLERAVKGDFSAGWIVGGYPKPWLSKEQTKFAEKFEFLVVQDIFPNDLMAGAALVLPANAWAEREGSFVNADGLAQPFEAAVNPPDGSRRDGQSLFELAGYTGLYRAERVREMMRGDAAGVVKLYEPPAMAEHGH